MTRRTRTVLRPFTLRLRTDFHQRNRPSMTWTTSKASHCS